MTFAAIAPATPGTPYLRPPLSRDQKIKIAVGATGAALLAIGVIAVASRKG